jgi:hypothetical protein
MSHNTTTIHGDSYGKVGIVINSGQRIVNQDNSNKTRMPNDVSTEQYSDFLNMLSRFLESGESEELTVAHHSKIKAELEIAKTADEKSGWKRLREFLCDGANAVTIITPIARFVAANSGTIAQWIRNIF